MRYALLVYGDSASARPFVDAATTVDAEGVRDGTAVPANDALESVNVLDADSLDDAIEWAEMLRRGVTVEIRPVNER
jgi:hypothetical protein